MGLDADAMLEAISASFAPQEAIDVSVTHARGRTLVHHYRVTRDGYRFVRQSWGGCGTLRQEYALRCVQVPEGPRSLRVGHLSRDLVQDTLDSINLPWRWARGRYERDRIVFRTKRDTMLAKTALGGL